MHLPVNTSTSLKTPAKICKRPWCKLDRYPRYITLSDAALIVVFGDGLLIMRL